jgi:Zn-dependent protease
MDFFDTAIYLVFAVVSAVLAVTVHEAAHGYAAKRLGDNTAFMLGRVTLNPIKHIDPVGTILLPGIFILGSLALGTSLMFFGYAKPVPINPRHFRNYRRDMNIAVAAGPGSNLLMALIWAVLSVVLMAVVGGSDVGHAVARGLGFAVAINLIMFAFNLLPILPLDGGRILLNFLPYHLAHRMAAMEPYGFFIVIGLIFLNVAAWWIAFVTTPAAYLIQLLVSPLRVIFG